MTICAAIILCVIFFTVSVYAEDYEPSVGAKVVDIILVRPAAVAGALLSTGAAIIIAIPAYSIGMGQPMAYALVQTPWRFAVARKLGNYHECVDDQPIATIPEYSTAN